MKECCGEPPVDWQWRRWKLQEVLIFVRRVIWVLRVSGAEDNDTANGFRSLVLAGVNDERAIMVSFINNYPCKPVGNDIWMSSHRGGRRWRVMRLGEDDLRRNMQGALLCVCRF